MMNVLSGLIRATDADCNTYYIPGRLPGVREEVEEREEELQGRLGRKVWRNRRGDGLQTARDSFTG